MAVGREAETVPMSPDSRTTGDMEDAEDNVPLKENVPYWTSCRVLLALMGFMCTINVYALRTNLSFAIVCMVKENISEEYGPTLNGTNTSVRGARYDENNTLDASIRSRCVSVDVGDSRRSYEGEFDWDKSLRGTILSSFFYGYICTQILGGWLAGRYGGKHVLGTAMVIVLAMTVVTPIAARTHPYLVIAVRVLMGLADGVVFPSMHTLWGQWAPPLERSKLMTFCYSGIFVGIIVALSFSGVLCEIQLDGGWPFIFYVYGATCFLWLCCWHIFVFDSPARHPRISQSERRYIERAIGHPPGEKRVAVPWLQFARSPAVWAIVVAHTCNNWGHYTLMTSLPLFMKEVLAFDIKQNGVYSALPFAAMAGGVVLCGQLADQLRRRAVLNTTWTRKLFQAVGGFLPAAFMVATAFIDCDTRMAGVAFLTLAMTFSAGALAGYQINHADIAPRFAGEIFGITNTVATIPGMISPSVVSALTPNGSKEEWQRVLFISGAIYSFGALFFLIFASGEEQSWDKVDNMSYQEDQEAKERFQIDDLALSTL